MTAREVAAHARIERLAAACGDLAANRDRRAHIRAVLEMLHDRLAIEILDGLDERQAA